MKAFSAAVMGGVLLLALGCGDSSKSTSPKSTATRSTSTAPNAACAKATAALHQFQSSREALGGALLNPSTDRAALAVTRKFSTDAQELARSLSGAPKRELDQMIGVLAQDERVLHSLAAHDLSRAGRESTGLSAGLDDSIARLETICATA